MNNITHNGSSRDLYDLFVEFCEKYSREVINFGKDKKTFSVAEYEADSQRRMVQGIIKSGEYGYRQDAYDTIRKTRVTAARKTHQSQEIPFYFLIHFPQGGLKKKAYILLDKFRWAGAKSLLRDSLTDFLSTGSNTYLVNINPIISTDLLHQLENADRVSELSLIRDTVPRDLADQVLLGDTEELKEKRVYTTRAKGGLQIKVREFYEKVKNRDSNYFELEGERAEEISVVIENAGMQRTLYLQTGGKYREAHALDENQLVMDGGFPTRQSIFEMSKDYLNHILTKEGEQSIDFG